MISWNFWGKIIGYVVAKTVSYNVDETGLKLTYNSGSQNLSAVNVNKNHKATHVEKWETVTITSWVQVEATGFSQWACLRERRQYEFRNCVADLPYCFAGTYASDMTRLNIFLVW